MPKFVFLWTDIALLLMVAGVLAYGWRVRSKPALRATLSRVAHDAPAMCSSVVFSCFVLVGLLDSIHYQARLPAVPRAAADAPVRVTPSWCNLR